MRRFNNLLLLTEVDNLGNLCYNKYIKSKEDNPMKFFKTKKPLIRYTMLNLITNEIEVYNLHEGDERNFVAMGYYDILNQERI